MRVATLWDLKSAVRHLVADIQSLADQTPIIPEYTYWVSLGGALAEVCRYAPPEQTISLTLDAGRWDATERILTLNPEDTGIAENQRTQWRNLLHIRDIYDPGVRGGGIHYILASDPARIKGGEYVLRTETPGTMGSTRFLQLGADAQGPLRLHFTWEYVLPDWDWTQDDTLSSVLGRRSETDVQNVFEVVYAGDASGDFLMMDRHVGPAIDLTVSKIAYTMAVSAALIGQFALSEREANPVLEAAIHYRRIALDALRFIG